MIEVNIALVHYPVLDKAKTKVATNITNFDIHDIARLGTCYGVKNYYLVHPMREQLMFVERLKDHWICGTGRTYNSLRGPSLKIVRPIESLDAIRSLNPECEFWGTSAKDDSHRLKIRRARERLLEGSSTPKSVCLVFGTGYGLCPEIKESMDEVLSPIEGRGPQDFRHLSVRSAVSIYLDRLLGQW